MPASACRRAGAAAAPPLPAAGVGDGLAPLRLEGGAVGQLARLGLADHLDELGRARQAAGVSGEDSVGAALHGVLFLLLLSARLKPGLQRLNPMPQALACGRDKPAPQPEG